MKEEMKPQINSTQINDLSQEKDKTKMNAVAAPRKQMNISRHINENFASSLETQNTMQNRQKINNYTVSTKFSHN